MPIQSSSSEGRAAELPNSLLGFEEHRAAVHVFPLLLRNQFGTRLWAEVAAVSALLQRLQEQFVVLLRLHLLQENTDGHIWPSSSIQVTTG